MRRRSLLLALPLVFAASACEKPRAYGDPNAIIVGAQNAVWDDVGDMVRDGLQPTIFTVRDERTFRVTQLDPGDRDWGRLREFRQVLLVGRESDEFMADALARAREAVGPPPQLLQAYDVWARGQVVTIMLLPPGTGGEGAEALVEPLHDLLDRQYRELMLSRMFASGFNPELADSLQSTYGFSMNLPRVYYWAREDSVFIFRNDNPDPRELIRQIGVTWRSPLPDAPLPMGEMVEWRQEVVDGYYEDEQMLELDFSQERQARLDGRQVHELQAIWANPPEVNWPRGGPVILRTVACPEQNRLYLVDAWLYAPGVDKYQYMLQLETIINSFRCGDAAPAPPPEAATGGASS